MFKINVFRKIPVISCILMLLFLSGCTQMDPTEAEVTITGEKSITKNGITFADYTDSLYKSWGFDSASNAISIPARSDYRCGLRIYRGEDAENYDSVKIEPGGPFPIISYIQPKYLEKDTMNYLTIYPLDVEGNCSLNVYSGNSDLRGMDDYWGNGPIHCINAYSYSPIVYENNINDRVEYYLFDPNPEYNPSEETMRDKMNEIVHQAIVDVQGVNKTVDQSMAWDGLVFPMGKLEYVFTEIELDSVIKYNAEYWWIVSNYVITDTSYHKVKIFHFPGFVLCWRTNKPHNQGATYIELASADGTDEIVLGSEYMFGYIGASITEVVKVVNVSGNIVFLQNGLSNPHPAGDLLFESTNNEWQGFAISPWNACFVSDPKIVKPQYEEYFFFHNVCHEFMHCNKNGNLTDIYSYQDTMNLMFFRSFYEFEPVKKKLTGNKLRYRTIGLEAMQWNDTHDGP